MFILPYLKDGCEPISNDLFLAPPAAKSHWINKERFFLDDNGILKSQPKTEGANTRLVVPASLRQTVMELCHELPSAGHQGVSRTMSKIKDKYHWYNMTKDINLFVLSCDTCNKNKKASRHNQFTKWTECIPLPSQTAEVTAQAAINEFFTRFGYPFQLFSDQGRNFESALFKAVCDLLQIHKARTTPYRPQSNGQVERQNRSLMDAVRCFVDSQQENWDQHIAQLGGAMRSSVNRRSGYTLNKLMLGRETNQPADLMFGSQRQRKYEGADMYIIDSEKAIKSAHTIARDKLKTSQERMKRDYDLRVLEKSYQPGDLVYVLDTAQI
ncbi:Hypothetical predicted protein [Mytilus galloprovincialis]|uniref:Integrase catalytic domain-containing protein n=1 Tax=Mytilus galloprovincialis TaxID=29158 RepID=A0A8B6E2V0_MYTGA|nr:Hypothetical predicted protein [Mytilus galloprovincialis]